MWRIADIKKCLQFFRPLRLFTVGVHCYLIVSVSFLCDYFKVSEDALEALIETSEGDLRRAITTLQSAARLKSPDKPEVGKNDVCEVAGVVPEKWVNGIIDVCSKSSFPETQDFVDKMIAEGRISHSTLCRFLKQIYGKSG